MPPTAESGAIVQSLFDSHYTALVHFAVARVGDQHLAEDLAAECFVRALKHPDPGSINAGWLFRTTYNLIGDAYRRSERDQRLVNALSVTVTGSSPRDDADVGEALSRLSADDRELLLLLFTDRLLAAEVATILGLTVSAVWKRTSRAKVRLRRALACTDDDPQGGTVIAVGLE